jgi:hypothetical protein
MLTGTKHFRGDDRESALHRRALRRLLTSLVELAGRVEIDERFGALILQSV